jgi:hypothetical protein
LAKALIATGEKHAQCMQMVAQNARFLDVPTRMRWRKAALADQRVENYRSPGDVTQPVAPTASAGSAPQANLGPAGSLGVKPSRSAVRRTITLVIVWLLLFLAPLIGYIIVDRDGPHAETQPPPSVAAEATFFDVLNTPLAIGVFALSTVALLLLLAGRMRKSIETTDRLTDLVPRAILGDAQAFKQIEAQKASFNSVLAVSANSQLSVVMLNHGRFQEALNYADVALGRIAGASAAMREYFASYMLHAILAHRAEALCGLHRFDEARAEKNRLATEFAKLPQTPATLYAIDLLIASASGDASQLQGLMAKKSEGLSFLADTLWEGWNVTFSTTQSPLRAAQFLADTAEDALLGTWLDATAPSLRARLQAMASTGL